MNIFIIILCLLIVILLKWVSNSFVENYTKDKSTTDNLDAFLKYKLNYRVTQDKLPDSIILRKYLDVAIRQGIFGIYKSSLSDTYYLDGKIRIELSDKGQPTLYRINDGTILYMNDKFLEIHKDNTELLVIISYLKERWVTC